MNAYRAQGDSVNKLIVGCISADSGGGFSAKLGIIELNKQNEGCDTNLGGVVGFLSDLSSNLHGGFDEKHGRSPKNAFHNTYHIIAVSNAAEALWRAAFSTEPKRVRNRRGIYDGHEQIYNSRDPLDLSGQLQEWNENHGTQITPEQLRYAIKIAVALHDIGNIAVSLKEDSNGDISIVFHTDGVYKAQGAETRSKDIAEKLLTLSKVSPEIIELVKHLILETTYNYSDPQSPAIFGVFMRVVDQIGNAYFNENPWHVIGLLREMVAENSETVFDPEYFFNFPVQRFPQLVTDENVRTAINFIFNSHREALQKGSTRADESEQSTHSLGNEKIKVRNFLAAWEHILTNNGLNLENLSDRRQFMRYVKQAVEACRMSQNSI
ncbi:MAG: hypothetical protein KatS3mg084_0526 [Candidatus Dojkabacteria bacterium]|nr:MAG: hypothetical protein KatS3mg084_0526 [Candidatus Dojkabacteria bacterium]